MTQTATAPQSPALASPRRAWWQFWRREEAHDSVCGKCGYVVTALPTFVCPECGSDLREVGIIRRDRPTRKLRWSDLPKAVRSKYRWRLAITATLASVLFASSIFLCSWSHEQQTWWFTSNSASYKSVAIESTFTTMRLLGMRYAREPSDLQVKVIVTGGNGVQHSTLVDLPELRMVYWYRTPPSGVAVRSDSTFNEESLLKWMGREVKADVSDPQVLAESRALVAAMKRYDGRVPKSQELVFENLVKQLTESAGPNTGPFKGGWSSTGKFSQPWWSVVFAFLAIFGPYQVYASLLGKRAMREGKAALIAEGLWEEPAADGPPAHSRTLTVLFSDMKDFTVRAAGSSRAELMKLLRANRRVVEKGVTKFGGNIVKTAGDGVLAKFDSATNAILAGVEIQRLAKLHNTTAAANETLELRIAISTGEVSIENDDVYGPAVNIAARLQECTPVGDVYLTDATRQAVTDSEVRTETVEAVELKGVRDKVVIHRAIAAPARP